MTTTLSATEQQQIANTILTQLGGNKFVVMTGSHSFGFGVNEKGNVYLQMKLRANKCKATHLQIALNAMDTYDIRFFNIRKKGFEFVTTECYSLEGAYDDMLQEVFIYKQRRAANNGALKNSTVMKYVEMFLFGNKGDDGVVLQRSPRLLWTGVFGAIKEGETELDAARRVFSENTGMAFRKWRFFMNCGDVAIFVGESPALEFVVVQHHCVVDTVGRDDVTAAMLGENARLVILSIKDDASEAIHPQLEPAQGAKPDFSKGLKIGIFCNEYTEFNALVTRLRDMPENINNRFFCVLSTVNMYGQTFDFIVRYEPNGPLFPGAENAIYIAGIRGMKESPELFNALIKPAYEQA